METRRSFLQKTAAAGAGMLVPWMVSVPKAQAAPAAKTPNLAKFVDPLLHPIPTLTPDTSRYPGQDYYELVMSGGTHHFHSQLGPSATLRYGALPYLGPTIEAQSGRPVMIKFINQLPTTDAAHPLAAAIDPTVPDPMMYQSPDGAPLPPGRAIPHLHGGFLPPQFDGHPHAWFTAGGQHGSHYYSEAGAAANEAIFTYPNLQAAASLWYHDHAMGITRLNVYAGLAALYLVRDALDTGRLDNPLGLPAGLYEVPLVIQDKQFNADGSQFYPTASGLAAPYPHPIWVPEFFGDTPVVNAVAYPYLNVEPRRYRLRLYNGSQARFYNFKFATQAKGNLPFWIIGMEQGLLPAPAQATTLLLAPGERADVIIDFASLALGTAVTLKNDAKAPYPGGQGGGVAQVMQFRVVTPLSVPFDPTMPPANLRLPAVPRLAPTPTAPRREIVLKETMDPATGQPTDVRLNGKWFDEGPIDETPKVGDTEIWQYINLTVDAHPMHSHLVKFQVYNRQPFDAKAYSTAWLAWVAAGRNPATKPLLASYFTGPAVPPPPEEMGWKDTVKCYPGEITRTIATYEVPPGTNLPAEYVYHCHILEHEENEMMRPFQVLAHE